MDCLNRVTSAVRRVSWWICCWILLQQFAPTTGISQQLGQQFNGSAGDSDPFGESQISNDPFAGIASGADPFGDNPFDLPDVFTQSKPKLIDDTNADNSEFVQHADASLGRTRMREFFTQNEPRPMLPIRSKLGGRISSGVVDPLMTSGQEQKLLAILNAYDDYDWTGHSVSDIAEKLKERCPIWIDRLELDLLGVDPESKVNYAREVPPGSLWSRLNLMFDPLEICVQVRSGRIEITSKDEADASPTIRIYDVSPLVMNGVARGDYDTLINIIAQSVEPDSWLVAGGQGSIFPYAMPGNPNVKGLLIVAAPTLTQRKVLALLDGLNQAVNVAADRSAVDNVSSFKAPVFQRPARPQSPGGAKPRFDPRIRVGGMF